MIKRQDWRGASAQRFRIRNTLWRVQVEVDKKSPSTPTSTPVWTGLYRVDFTKSKCDITCWWSMRLTYYAGAICDRYREQPCCQHSLLSWRSVCSLWIGRRRPSRLETTSGKWTGWKNSQLTEFRSAPPEVVCQVRAQYNHVHVSINLRTISNFVSKLIKLVDINLYLVRPFVASIWEFALSTA